MSTANVVAIILAIISATGASLVAGWLQRPKTQADAKAALVSGEVAMSAEAREWARDAMTRLTAAEAKSDAANTKLDSANVKLDALEARFEQLVVHVHACHQEIVRTGGRVPDMPPGLLATAQ